MAHDVFISYSHHDAAAADVVRAVLEADGIRCWIAPRDVPVGQDWKQHIVEAIGAARAVVLLLSGTADRSVQVMQEASIAFDAEPQIPILPFRIEDVRPTGNLRYCIGSSHWLDALTPDVEGHSRRLAAELRSRGYVATRERGTVEFTNDASLGDAPPRVANPAPPSADTPTAEAGLAEPVRSPDVRVSRRSGGRRGVLAACAVAAATALVLGTIFRRPERTGAVETRRADPRPTPTAAPSHAPAPAPTAEVRNSGPPVPIAPPVRTERPPSTATSIRASLGGGHSAPADAQERRSLPARGESTDTPPLPNARAHPVRPASAAPSADCARLLERASLGEPLSAQETARLTRDCRAGAP